MCTISLANVNICGMPYDNGQRRAIQNRITDVNTHLSYIVMKCDRDVLVNVCNNMKISWLIKALYDIHI